MCDSEEWWTRAACRGIDTELFFPAPGEVPTEALAVCRGCEVTERCLAEAVARHELFGVWGGTTARQRERARSPRQLRRLQRAVGIAEDALRHGMEPVAAIATRLCVDLETARELAVSPEVAAVLQNASSAH